MVKYWHCEGSLVVTDDVMGGSGELLIEVKDIPESVNKETIARIAASLCSFKVM